ncbi:MAG: ABC transporter substrate-binding protein [Actinomycetota bacterium]|nr:ABC transporter substrate-binding protein [Actinomycetota bacterium]
MALLVTVTLGAGCGDKDRDPGTRSEYAPRYEPPEDARRGGVLRVMASGDVDSLDPGSLQNQFSVVVSYATQRTLISPTLGPEPGLIPDLAASLPMIDRGGGTIDFRIRRDVRFSPPVSRRIVADDFKYALERSLLPGVANGYLRTYLGTLRGFDRAERAALKDPTAAPDISGVQALGFDRLRLRFEGRVPALAVEALSLPFAAPVPRRYAARFDAEIPSSYGRHVVSSGPYMVPNDPAGNLTGTTPGVQTKLVRNPLWNPQGDFRPAYLDEIRIGTGYTNTGAASDRILAGRSRVNGDFAPEPAVLEEAARDFPDQLMMIPAGAVLYAAMNTTIEPLDDPDVRKAVVAGADRNALRLARGGRFAGPLATHFIPPGVPGFEEAGGHKGPGFDFLAAPGGDPELAAEYMRRAGYPDGRYDGAEELEMVTDTTGVGRRTGEVVRRAFTAIGIPVKTRAVARDIMYSRFCNVPSAGVAICPNVGWVRQLDDAQTVLEQTFSGPAIQSSNNSNWPQLDVPPINRAIARARWVSEPAARARAWGRVDRMITAQAPAIPITWGEVPSIFSADVVNVIDSANASPALPMVSLRPSD